MQVNLNTPATSIMSGSAPVAPAAQTKTPTTLPTAPDTVTLSAEAKAMFAADLAGQSVNSSSSISLNTESPTIGTLGSGSGNEPPMDEEEEKDKEK